jgi:predicted MPP superfamily phosphohydrolase
VTRTVSALYLDEDVAAVIAPMLRARGHAARTVLEERRTGLSDRAQLEFAADRGWVLVSHNREDFVRLATEFVVAGRTHGGIIVCTRRPPRVVADRISETLHRVAADEFRNMLLHA